MATPFDQAFAPFSMGDQETSNVLQQILGGGFNGPAAVNVQDPGPFRLPVQDLGVLPSPQVRAPRERASLLDIIGGLSDAVAQVGGSTPQFQPTIDARVNRQQQTQAFDLDRKLAEQRLQTGELGIENLGREQIGQALAGIAQSENPAQDFLAVAEIAGFPPDKANAIAAELERNPAAAQQLATAFGFEPPQQGSLPSAVQNFQAFQEILRTQGPEAAKQFLALAQPTSQIQPFQAARLGFDAEELRIKQRELALKEEQAQNPPLTAPERKEIRKLQLSFPKISASFRSATKDIDQQIKDAKRLREHPGLAGITGAIQGRLPFSLRGSSNAAQSILDTMLARGTFAELQEIRNNSPTGGALGNVSDAEGRRLQAAVGTLSQAQTKEDFQRALDNYINELRFSKKNLSTTFDETKELISRAGEAPASQSRNVRGGRLDPALEAELRRRGLR